MEKVYLVYEECIIRDGDTMSETKILGTFGTREKALEKYREAKQNIINDWDIDHKDEEFEYLWEEDETITNTDCSYSICDSEYDKQYYLQLVQMAVE